MTPTDMPGDVRRFILTSVPSVPYLEAILLLRSDPGASWDASRVARRLYLAEQKAAELLQALAAAGVAGEVGEAPGCFQFRPVTAELAGMLDRVAQAYTTHLLGVTDLIHSRIDKRAQQFADAFRWRKDS
ncbi:MAG TPA: hypothetical protein VLI46_13485 [Ramlibacter sp.]|nr:hypothetical protein [Ramlibacter sp.]